MPSSESHLIINISIACGVILFGYAWGTHKERKHYSSISKREKALKHLAATSVDYETMVQSDPDNIVQHVRFVKGQVVLAESFVKSFWNHLKTFLTGNLSSYESLMERARREAIIRMKEDAQGADIIVNLRMDTSSSCPSGKNDGKDIQNIEILASGTAIYFEKNDSQIASLESCPQN